MSTGIIVKKKKQRKGYTVLVLTPEKGFIQLFLGVSKKKLIQSIQDLSIVELDIAPMTDLQSIPNINDITVLYSFTPPEMEYFHFFSLQKLLLEIKKITYYMDNENHNKLFIMINALLSTSLKIKDYKTSGTLLLIFFLKWNLSYKIHEEILYCHFCHKKIIRKNTIPSKLFLLTEIPNFICIECQPYKSISYIELNKQEIQQLHNIVFLPLDNLLEQLSQQESINKILEHYIEYYFHISTDQLFLKKENPFLYL